ncbi:hypothetical protein GJ496_005923 [Pomphorhynchus laevis]|nr:hypothetical protein GJ496_005923 [Pomphorhynchus laevis]
MCLYNNSSVVLNNNINSNTLKQLVWLNQVCNIPQDNNRFDCHPGPDANEEECVKRGCCWNDNLAETNPNVPMCYFPQDYSAYKVTLIEKMSNGYRYTIEKELGQSAFLPDEILKLNVELIFVSSTIARIRIVDPANKRFEVPYVYTKDDSNNEPLQMNYDIQVKSYPFSLKVVNILTNQVIIDTSIAPLLYSDQFIQFSTLLPSYFVYGLGEHRNPMRLTTSWQTLSFWTRDQFPELHKNLYGVNPFAMYIDDNGIAGGFFFMNANAMDAVLQPMPAITLRTIGGIIDLFVYSGPTAEDVVRQHWSIVSPPYFQPMWAMGFHLCRYGYLDINDLRAVMNRMKSTNFPYDTQWTDIDTMRKFLVFTYDTVKWAGLPELVDELHSNDMHYIPINDPCIGSKEPPGTYQAFDKGMKHDLFIKKDDGSILIANVWPGDCYMPDFTHPNAHEWWKNEIMMFNATAPLDGLWIDMNEPALFVNGSVNGCPDNKWENPWYVPKIAEGILRSRTICASSKHHAGLHYDMHSIYGMIESKVTMEVLQELDPNRRHFVLTRAHYTGTGKWAAHWTGDNYARWDDLYYSIPEAIVYNMFGISFVGPDICGFNEETTEELCMRWMQLGAFLPFMRNHNTFGQRHQDPAIWSEPSRSVMKQALMMRYSLLPFWYTSHYQASKNIQTVIQPLFYLYPQNSVARWLDTQFFIGRSIMVAPVLNRGVNMLSVFLPKEEEIWYTFPDLEIVEPVNEYINVPVTDFTIGLYTKPGCIIPMMSVNESMNLLQNVKIANFSLLVTLPFYNEMVEGSMYWDDGLALLDTQNTLLDFYLHEETLLISKRKTMFLQRMMLQNITIGGFTRNRIISVTANGIQIPFTQNGHILKINNMNTNLNGPESISIRWIFSNERASKFEL